MTYLHQIKKVFYKKRVASQFRKTHKCYRSVEAQTQSHTQWMLQYKYIESTFIF